MASSKRSSISITGSTQHLVEVATKRRIYMKKKKKIAAVLIPILALLFLIFFVLFVVYLVKYELLLNEKICTSKDCIDTANTFQQIMDFRKDPCDDFYAYACGNFPLEYPIPEGGLTRSWFDNGEHKLSQMIRKVLDDPDGNATTEALRMTRTLYRSCLNTDELEVLGLRPLYDLLEKVGLPKFPTEKSAEDFNLGKTLGLLQKNTNMDLIIGLGIDRGSLQPGADNDTFIIEFSVATSPLSSASLFRDVPSPAVLEALKIFHQKPEEVMASVRRDPSTLDISVAMTPQQLLVQELKFIANIMSNIKADIGEIEDEPPKNQSDVLKDALKILSFGVHLIQAVEGDNNVTEELREEGQNKQEMTTAKFEEFLDGHSPSQHPAQKINWKDYLDAVFSGEKGYWTYDFNEDNIHIAKISDFTALSTFLGNSKAITIQRFIWWHVVKKYARFTTEEMQEAYEDLHAAIFGKSAIQRHETCLSLVRKYLNTPLIKEIKNSFGLANDTTKAKEMLQGIKEEFESLVNNLDWMDVQTKRQNIRKAHAIKSFIGYKSMVLDDKTVDKHFEDLKMEEDKFLINLVGIEAWQMQTAVRVLKQNNESVLGVLQNIINPLQVNAFYDRQSNAILLNYGAIGSILGHELTHGFDFEGKNYDLHGEKQEQIWSKEITLHFEQRAQCFVNQYNKFNITKNKKLDGKFTLSENIADNGGLRESYFAYQAYIKKFGPEPKLPGFENFSAEQLLFISFATIWCESSRERYLDLLDKDSHSPNRIRVLATLQNMREFAQAFKCPANSNMNPSHKCILW